MDMAEVCRSLHKPFAAATVAIKDGQFAGSALLLLTVSRLL